MRADKAVKASTLDSIAVSAGFTNAVGEDIDASAGSKEGA